MAQKAKTVRTKNGRTATEYYDSDGNKTETLAGGGRMWRNNNPGNLRGGKETIGKDKDGVAIFPDLDTGRKAQADMLRESSLYKGKTIKEMVPIYAPASDGNNVPGYTKDIGDFSGLDINRKIEDLNVQEYEQLMNAIQRREGAIDKDDTRFNNPDDFVFCDQDTGEPIQKFDRQFRIRVPPGPPTPTSEWSPLPSCRSWRPPHGRRSARTAGWRGLDSSGES